MTSPLSVLLENELLRYGRLYWQPETAADGPCACLLFPICTRARDITWAGDEAGKLHVKQGKGKKDRILSLNAPSLELLKIWRDRRYDQTSKLLFTTREGKPLSDRWLRKMVETYSKKAGVDKHVHPHTLRHTFATNLYRSSGHNLRVVQLALGHSSIQTTEIYTHIANDEVGEEMRKLRQAA